MLPGPPSRHQGHLHLAPQQHQHQWTLRSRKLLLYLDRTELHPWNMLRQSDQTLHHLRNSPKKSHKNNTGVKSDQLLQRTQPLPNLRPGKCPLTLIFSIKYHISRPVSSILTFHSIPLDRIYQYPTPIKNKIPHTFPINFFCTSIRHIIYFYNQSHMDDFNSTQPEQ